MNLLLNPIWPLIFGTVFNSEVTIEQVDSPRSLCGEGPHWDESTQSLYYVDIDGPNETLLRYDFNENKTYKANVDGVPLMSFVLPVEGTTDEFLVGTKHSGLIIRWDGKSPKGEIVQTVFEVEENITTNRFNDGKADPSGRFVGGTMRLDDCPGEYCDCNSPLSAPNASLYSFAKGLGVKILLEDVAISNGLTWVKKTNESGYTFYYVDSCTHELSAFDYDIETGDLANEQIAFSLEKYGQAPDFIFDGMTNDVEGNIYIAANGGGKVMKLDPMSGTLLAEYKIPNVQQVTSVAFGGPKLDILFVTTASRGNQPDEAGHLYKITGLNAVGTPGDKVNV